MRLIDAESLKENLSKWLKQVDPTHPSDIPPMDDIIVSTIITIEEEPTVDAIPISFIEEMKAWAEENDFALYASDLNHLLLTWAERKEE